jgi:hypothetical protein
MFSGTRQRLYNLEEVVLLVTETTALTEPTHEGRLVQRPFEEAPWSILHGTAMKGRRWFVPSGRCKTGHKASLISESRRRTGMNVSLLLRDEAFESTFVCYFCMKDKKFIHRYLTYFGASVNFLFHTC